MAVAWPLPMLGFVQAYPEILLSIACFLFLLLFPLRHSRMPINWPVFGMLPAVVVHFHHLHDYLADLLLHVGCTWLFRGPWFLGMDMVLSCDPANVNHILSGNFANYRKGDEFNEVFDILGDGLFNADAESWRIQRKLAHNYIGDRSFRSFVATATREKTEKGLLPVLLLKSEREEVAELQDLFMRLSFDVTSLMVFGVDPGCLSANLPAIPFAVAIDDAWEALLFRHAVPKSWWKILKRLNVGTEKKLAKAWKVIDHFICQVISERREERRVANINAVQKETSTPRTNDLLTSYIDNVVEEIQGKFEPHKFLRDNVLTFMIAGRDGFAICLSWFFWLLSKNPTAEAKILEELSLHRSREKESMVFDAEELGRMVYLHGAVCETLRLFPPVPYEEKTAVNPDVLPSGMKVEPGDKILFSVYAMGRMEEIWGKDCMEFNPGRWIAEDGRPKHVPAYKFMAFNSGPRICPGRDIALTQIKTVAAAVVWNFRVEVLDRQMVAPKNAVLLRMQHGMLVKLRRRERGCCVQSI
ncbi:unnamed protein product [Musa hybrid cultivar]